jgi:hypothetical protein
MEMGSRYSMAGGTAPIHRSIRVYRQTPITPRRLLTYLPTYLGRWKGIWLPRNCAMLPLGPNWRPGGGFVGQSIGVHWPVETPRFEFLAPVDVHEAGSTGGVWRGRAKLPASYPACTCSMTEVKPRHCQTSLRFSCHSPLLSWMLGGPSSLSQDWIQQPLDGTIH